jgi:thiamine-phosphate pyrophosphorylase
MDAKLLAWARAVSRRRNCPPCLPPLWLFTDARRLADPRPVVARLPKGLAGVVLRHDADPERAALGRDLARMCRARRLKLVVAGDPRLAAALGAGMHLRGGRWPAGAPIAPRRQGTLLTSSAHSGADLRRAARAGAVLAFLSPAFATKSHPDAAALGPLRWARLARGAASPKATQPQTALHVATPHVATPRNSALRVPAPAKSPPAKSVLPKSALHVAALGGISGASVRRLPRNLCRQAGAIEALSDQP